MKRKSTTLPRASKGIPHTLTTFSDKDIAVAAGVKTGSVAVARCRGEISTLNKLVLWINWHRILIERRKMK